MLLELASFLWATAAVPGAFPLTLAMQSLDGRPIIGIPARPSEGNRRRGTNRFAMRERPSPSCHRASRVVAARFSQSGSVDLEMRNGRIYRALLSADCPALGYYSTLYVAPGPDGRLCAGRDAIVSRAGGECLITSFRRLEPQRRR